MAAASSPKPRASSPRCVRSCCRSAARPPPCTPCVPALLVTPAPPGSRRPIHREARQPQRRSTPAPCPLRPARPAASCTLGPSTCPPAPGLQGRCRWACSALARWPAPPRPPPAGPERARWQARQPRWPARLHPCTFLQSAPGRQVWPAGLLKRAAPPESHEAAPARLCGAPTLCHPSS